jgi:hypothetical protein
MNDLTQKLIDKDGITEFNDISGFTSPVINVSDTNKLTEIQKPDGNKIIDK